MAFKQIDVFTNKPLPGNPPDVFFSEAALSETDMLALTRETFLSGATFVFRRHTAVEREKGIRVRIFSKSGELPFAGHPTLGTAFVLRQLLLDSPEIGFPDKARIGQQICLGLNVGKIAVTFEIDKE